MIGDNCCRCVCFLLKTYNLSISVFKQLTHLIKNIFINKTNNVAFDHADTSNQPEHQLRT